MSEKNCYIKELLERYNLKSRQSIYDWVQKGLKQDFHKDKTGKSYVTSDQIGLLDQLQKYLQTPNAVLSNFIPLSTVQIDSPIDSTIDSSKNGHKSEIAAQSIDNQLLLELTAKIGWAISSQLAQQLTETNPLYRHEALEKAKELGWLLTSKEVQKLIGVKPKTKKGDNTYQRGCWLFTKSGKIGTQTAWKVDKIFEVQSKL